MYSSYRSLVNLLIFSVALSYGAVIRYESQEIIEDVSQAEFPRASLPVENSTHSYWLFSEPDVNPLAAAGSHGKLTEDADVCIIGSGMTGVSTAYHLSQTNPNLKTVILEARDFCT